MSIEISKRPAGGEQRRIEDIIADFDDILGYINGANVGQDNLATVLAQYVSANNGNNRGHGKVLNTPEMNTTPGAAYVKWPQAPDSVIVDLPTDGLMFISFSALWKGNAAVPSAAIFLNENQLKIASPGAAPVVQETSINVGVNLTQYSRLVTCGYNNQDGKPGLRSGPGESTAGTADVTTGQVISFLDAPNNNYALGPMCMVFAAAGTYEVSIRYKCTDLIFIKNRQLRVWTMGF